MSNVFPTVRMSCECGAVTSMFHKPGCRVLDAMSNESNSMKPAPQSERFTDELEALSKLPFEMGCNLLERWERLYNEVKIILKNREDTFNQNLRLIGELKKAESDLASVTIQLDVAKGSNQTFIRQIRGLQSDLAAVKAECLPFLKELERRVTKNGEEITGLYDAIKKLKGKS